MIETLKIWKVSVVIVGGKGRGNILHFKSNNLFKSALILKINIKIGPNYEKIGVEHMQPANKQISLRYGAISSMHVLFEGWMGSFRIL